MSKLERGHLQVVSTDKPFSYRITKATRNRSAKAGEQVLRELSGWTITGIRETPDGDEIAGASTPGINGKIRVALLARAIAHTIEHNSNKSQRNELLSIVADQWNKLCEKYNTSKVYPDNDPDNETTRSKEEDDGYQSIDEVMSDVE